MRYLEYAIVIFVDIRGFTLWSSRAEVGPHLQSFMDDFYAIFYQFAPKKEGFVLKPNGDGIILVQSSGRESSKLNDMLDSLLLHKVQPIRDSFITLCSDYRQITRYQVQLGLAFGISSGLVHRIRYPIQRRVFATDFVSGTMNLASRLCDLARPEGIVISADAFPEWQPRREQQYQLYLMPVKSYSDQLHVWVSSEIAQDHVPRETRTKLVEFHIGTICYEPDLDAVVLAHRNNDRKLYPSLWETGGGHMLEGETVEDAARRIASAEHGLPVTVEKEASITTYLIELERLAIPGIKFLCLFSKNDFNDTVDPRQHTEVKLVPISELVRDDLWPEEILIPGTKRDITELVNRYKQIEET